MKASKLDASPILQRSNSNPHLLASFPPPTAPLPPLPTSRSLIVPPLPPKASHQLPGLPSAPASSTITIRPSAPTHRTASFNTAVPTSRARTPLTEADLIPYVEFGESETTLCGHITTSLIQAQKDKEWSEMISQSGPLGDALSRSDGNPKVITILHGIFFSSSLFVFGSSR